MRAGEIVDTVEQRLRCEHRRRGLCIATSGALESAPLGSTSRRRVRATPRASAERAGRRGSVAHPHAPRRHRRAPPDRAGGMDRPAGGGVASVSAETLRWSSRSRTQRRISVVGGSPSSSATWRSSVSREAGNRTAYTCAGSAAGRRPRCPGVGGASPRSSASARVSASVASQASMSRRLSFMGSPRTVSARTASPSKRLLPHHRPAGGWSFGATMTVTTKPAPDEYPVTLTVRPLELPAERTHRRKSWHASVAHSTGTFVSPDPFRSARRPGS